jgi:glycosyltransferase involved in cell wall biosynthesis
VDILFVSRCLPYPQHFGDRLILFHLLAELRARGHSCDVIALTDPSDESSWFDPSAAFCRRLSIVREKPRSALQYLLRLKRPFPRSAARSWNPEMWQAIAGTIQTHRYDVVHAFGGVQVYEYRRLFEHLPAIIEPYESYSLWLERACADTPDWLERQWARVTLGAARRFESVMFAPYDRTVVVTDADRRTLESLSPGLRVVVIPNGVNRAETPRIERTSELLFLGNFGYGPNTRAALRLATEVLPRVRRDVPGARLVLVGADPPPDIRALNSEHIDVTGLVPDIEPYLARTACFVAPMTQGAGIKNKVLEAMAHGVPVVTTSIGADGIDATNGQEILVASTIDDIVRDTVRILTDQPLADRLGAAGQAFVRTHHAWPDVARRYEALYAEVIAGRSGERQ